MSFGESLLCARVGEAKLEGFQCRGEQTLLEARAICLNAPWWERATGRERKTRPGGSEAPERSGGVQSRHQ